MPRYVVKAVGAILAVVVLIFVVGQVTQLGRQTSGLTVAPPQPVASVAQPASAQVLSVQPPRGQGPIKVTSRILEPTYSVAPGDTLGTIAAKSGASVEALQGINNLNDRNSLSVGQKLVIPN